MNWVDKILFGPGYCQDCGLIKPLAMLAMPGLHENERGELEGGTISLVATERQGYCLQCAEKLLEKMKRKDA